MFQIHLGWIHPSLMDPCIPEPARKVMDSTTTQHIQIRSIRVVLQMCAFWPQSLQTSARMFGGWEPTFAKWQGHEQVCSSKHPKGACLVLCCVEHNKWVNFEYFNQL